MYRAARQDEEANYPEFYSHGAGSGGQARVPTVAQGASGGGGIAAMADAAVLRRYSTRPGGFVGKTMRSFNLGGLGEQHGEAQEMEKRRRRPLADDGKGYGRGNQGDHNDWAVQIPQQPLSAPPELGHERTSGMYFGYDGARDSQDIGTQNVHSLETQHLLDRRQPPLTQATQQLSASSESHPYLGSQQTQLQRDQVSQQGATSPPRNYATGTRPKMSWSEATRAPIEQAMTRHGDLRAPNEQAVLQRGNLRAPNEQAVLRPAPGGSGLARARSVLQRSDVVMHTHM